MGSDLTYKDREGGGKALPRYEEGGAITSDAIQKFVYQQGAQRVRTAERHRHAQQMRRRPNDRVQHFRERPSDNPLVLTIGALNTYFQQAGLVHDLPAGNQQAMAAALKG
ncbi:MAG: hypothetical protein IPP83_12675 [Flavobacteriales bacterium]|nr:hypothetical protein [Flavobacteriales bacterium]